MLGIVLRCGYICMLRNDPHVIIQGDLVLIPKTIGEVGLFVQKRFLSAPRDFRRNEVIFSLGYRNLTLMTDCLLYLDEERVDVILTNGLIG